MKFMNASLYVLVKNLLDSDFEQLSQEFSSNLVELVKPKGVYLHEYLNSFKGFFNEKMPDRYEFLSSLKDKCISEKDYLHPIDVYIVFKMHKMGDYHNL